MKLQTLLLTTGLTLSGFAFSQTLEPSLRSKAAITFNKTTTVSQTSKSTTPMGDMLSTNKSDLKSTVTVSATTEKGGTVEMKVTAVKMDVSQNDESASYDSEKPEDGNEMLKGPAEQMIKKPTVITFDSKGLVTDVKASMKEISEAMGMTKGEPLTIFLNIDKAVKPGDTWTTENKTKETNTKSTYTYKSFSNNEAIIEVSSTIKVDADIQQMGMTMHQTMEGKSTATLTVDAKTLLVKKQSLTSSMSGDVDARGQKIPVTVFQTLEERVN